MQFRSSTITQERNLEEVKEEELLSQALRLVQDPTGTSRSLSLDRPIFLFS